MLVPDEETDVGRIDEKKPVLRVVDYVDDLIRDCLLYTSDAADD